MIADDCCEPVRTGLGCEGKHVDLTQWDCHLIKS